MQLFKYIGYKWKKKFGQMNNNQNEALLQRYKEQYFGKTYQWVRQLNNEAIGDVVRVVDVKMRGNMVLLVFNAGTPINIDLVGQYLQPCGSNDIPPVPSISDGGPIAIPEELKGYQTDKISFSQPQLPPPPEPKKKSELFAMFQSEEKDITLPIRIKMPDIALVKMMYNNAADKNAFLGEFAQYVIDNIGMETAKDAIRRLLDDAPKEVAEESIQNPDGPIVS